MKYRDPNPLSYAGGYSLDLYCDHVNDDHGWKVFPKTFYGETFAECAKDARNKGWIIHRKTHTATCPKCAIKDPPDLERPGAS